MNKKNPQKIKTVFLLLCGINTRVMKMARLPFCGAKTRAGTPCKRPAGWGTDHVGEGRCKLHGGATPRGPLHPRYKHGKYSKYEVVITNHRFRGKRLIVNEVVVEFDMDGRCRGIVITDQQAREIHDPSLPLRPQDIEAMRSTPGFDVDIRRRSGR